jgi:hypothetical protein
VNELRSLRAEKLTLHAVGDIGALRKRLAACTGTSPEKAGPESMWGVLRYAQV